MRNTEAKSWQEIKQKQLCREIVEEDAEFVGAWGSQTAIAAWTGQSIDMFEEGEVFIYEALEPRTYGCMGGRPGARGSEQSCAYMLFGSQGR